MKKRFSNNKGFSLVELIIVVAIMAILIGILAPQYIKYVEKSRISGDADLVDSVKKGVETMISDPDYDITAGTISISGSNITVSTFDAKEGGSSVVEKVMGSDWKKQKFKSKLYKKNTVVITVTIGGDGIPTVGVTGLPTATS